MFAFIPFAVFLLKFVRKESGERRMDELSTEQIDIEPYHGRHKKSYNPVITVTLSGGGPCEISYLRAMYRGFRAPVVKSIHYAVSNI